LTSPSPIKTNLLPPPSDEEYAALKESIAKHGFWDSNPVVVDENGDILDGHTRARACHELGVPFKTVTRKGLSDWEKIEYAVQSNLARRQLTPAQRRPLLKRLAELHDKELKAQAEVARKAGNAKGGKVKSGRVASETGLDEPTQEARSRTAAADASQTRFDEPVVQGAPPKADRLETLGKMVGVSRATVARDEQILGRMEKIEVEAQRQNRDDVIRLLNGSRPNLDELERAVGLRAPLPTAEKPDADRLGWVSNLAQALNTLAPALSDEEADALYDKLASQDTASIQLGQLRGAVAAARKRAGA
jgi:hypothetical protein